MGSAALANWALLGAELRVRLAPQFDHPDRFEVLSREEAAEIEAVAAQIIPADDTPGAREAGVIYFIDRALATFDRDKRETYANGLAELQTKISELFLPATRFSQLSSEQQVEVLKAIEKTTFFTLVRLHTVEGFLSAPRHGGNRGRIGWKALGFDDGFSFEPPFGFYDRT
jgi:gluconate 2-dehydrogenase gamma chain